MRPEFPDLHGPYLDRPRVGARAERRISLARRRAARTTVRDGRTVVPRAGSPTREQVAVGWSVGRGRPDSSVLCVPRRAT